MNALDIVRILKPVSHYCSMQKDKAQFFSKDYSRIVEIKWSGTEWYVFFLQRCGYKNMFIKNIEYLSGNEDSCGVKNFQYMCKGFLL